MNTYGKKRGCFSPLCEKIVNLDDAAGQSIPDRTPPPKKHVDLGANAFASIRGEDISGVGRNVEESEEVVRERYRGCLGKASWEQPVAERFHGKPCEELNVWGLPDTPKGYGLGHGKRFVKYNPAGVSEVDGKTVRKEIPFIQKDFQKTFRRSAGKATWDTHTAKK